MLNTLPVSISDIRLPLLALCLLFMSPAWEPTLPMLAAHTNKSSITFINKSGEPALVKLVGPSRQTVDVANGGSETVNVSGGSYHILVRYGSPGKYRYSKGDPFDVRETATGYEKVTITLHTVAGGNYDSRPSSPSEFERGN